MSKDCLFCKIIKGEIPCAKVYQDETVIAFLDIFPVSRGHMVVAPLEHFSTFLDFPEDRMKNYFTILQKLASQAKDNLKAEGINILQNNFEAAGQVVPHLHFHIIPRWASDGKLIVRQAKVKAEPQDLEAVLKELR